MHELINLRKYLITLIDYSKYPDPNSDYIQGKITAYKHIIEGIDTGIKILEVREEK